jgi:hypothetical protein
LFLRLCFCLFLRLCLFLLLCPHLLPYTYTGLVSISWHTRLLPLPTCRPATQWP